MGKPGYFSDDVWAAVRTALDDAGIQSSEADYGNGTVFEVEASVIARAILAAEKRGEDRERERCAAYVEKLGTREHNAMSFSSYPMATDIAAAIRKGAR